LNVDKQFWANVMLIQNTIGIDESYFARELGLNTQKFQFHKMNELSIPFHGVNNLSRKIGISLDAILEKKITSTQLTAAIKHNWSARIPEKYSVGDGSRSFTVRHILSFAKKYGIYEETCAHFGLDPFCFEYKVDFPISVQLASDILQFIAHRVNLSENDYSQMSFANSMYFKNSQFGRDLSQSRNTTEVFEKFLDVSNHVEENWSYSIQHADKHTLVLNSYSTEKLSDLYKRKDYSSYTFAKFRASMGTHLVRYLGFEGTKATITKSIHQGDNYCQFTFDFRDLRPLSA
jgi:hypothetical protein